VTVYRSGAFSSQFYGNIFCGDAQNNLVHRRSLVPDGVLFRSERLDQGTEFLRSKDNWFRPVNFVNAPDGTLYVLDMAREVLEAVHIPMDVVSHLDLTHGRDRGRIYRVIPNGYKRPAQPRLANFTTGELVACLESPHAWWRETAHRLLYEQQDKSAQGPLRRLVERSSQPQSVVHALWSLEGLKVLSQRDVMTGLTNASPGVRENALRLAESRLNQSKELRSRCLELVNDADPRVRFQLAFALGEVEDMRAVKALADIAKDDASDYFIRTAILSSSFNRAAALIAELLDDGHFVQSASANELFQELARVVGARRRKDEIPLVLAAAFSKTSLALQQAITIGLSEGLRNSGAHLGIWIASLDRPAAQRLRTLMAKAILTIRDDKAEAEQIKSALQFLENASTESAAAPVIALLDRFPPAPIQIAAIQTLSRISESGVETTLLSRWKNVSPEARREILSSLLTRKERIDALLEAIESGRIATGGLEAASRAALLHHAEPSIRRRAIALWGAEKSGTRREAIQRYRQALDLKGNPDGGQQIFQRLCSTCHRLNNMGTELGPNLALASNRSRDELLTHILDPNLEVNPAYMQYSVETTEGETFTGLISSDQSASVTLKGLNFERTIPRRQIKKISGEGLSLMPEGLEQGLSFQEMADLLSFLIESQYDFGTSGQSSSRDIPEPVRKR